PRDSRRIVADCADRPRRQCESDRRGGGVAARGLRRAGDSTAERSGGGIASPIGGERRPGGIDAGRLRGRPRRIIGGGPLLSGIFVTGTDTGVGKTVAAAALMHRYRGAARVRYWKPIQTGIESDDDTMDV